MSGERKKQAEEIFEIIRHGDGAHQEWLHNTLLQWADQTPKPSREARDEESRWVVPVDLIKDIKLSPTADDIFNQIVSAIAHAVTMAERERILKILEMPNVVARVADIREAILSPPKPGGEE